MTNDERDAMVCDEVRVVGRDLPRILKTTGDEGCAVSVPRQQIADFLAKTNAYDGDHGVGNIAAAQSLFAALDGEQ